LQHSCGSRRILACPASLKFQKKTARNVCTTYANHLRHSKIRWARGLGRCRLGYVSIHRTRHNHSSSLNVASGQSGQSTLTTLMPAVLSASLSGVQLVQSTYARYIPDSIVQFARACYIFAVTGVASLSRKNTRGGLAPPPQKKSLPRLISN